MLKNHHLDVARLVLRVIFVTLVLAASACRGGVPGPQATQRPLVITGVHVVDVREGRVDSNRTLVIEGGTVARVVAAGLEPRGSVRVGNLAGAFVIPGLWDMHVHL